MTEQLKCPFCISWESDNEINIARHFEKEHEYKSFLMLARILLGNKTTEQRIRESIKRYQTMHDLCNDFWGRDMYMTIIEELEKLLNE